MKYILVLFLFFSMLTNANAQQPNYLNVSEIIQKFNNLTVGDSQFFATDTPSSNIYLPKDCYTLTENNKDLLGLINPGSLIIKNTKPHGVFAVWYMSCLDRVFTYVLNNNRYTSAQSGVSFDILDQGVSALSGLGNLETIRTNLWTAMPQALKVQIVKNAVTMLYGSEELLDLGDINYESFIDLEIKKIPEKMSVQDAYVFILTELAMRNEYLMY